MPTNNNSQPERGLSIQQRYEQAQQRFNVARAVIECPDVSPVGKLHLGLAYSSFATIAALGISKASIEAYCALVACTLAIGLLIHKIRETGPEAGRNWARTPKSRPRRGHKSKFRGSS